MSQISWIVSYPKSGNSWLRVMLTSYLTDMAVTSEDSVEEFVPDFHNLARDGIMIPLDESRPLLVKTHFLPSVELMWQYKYSTIRAVYLVRNPRDVLLSSARHLDIAPSEDETSRNWARDFIKSRGEPRWLRQLGTWPENVQEWTFLDRVRRHFPRIEVLVVRYEDMRRDPINQFQRVLDFLALDRDKDAGRVRRAVENSSIARMRMFENAERSRDASMFNKFERKNAFVGQGRSDQSLTIFGEDVEMAYRQLMEEDGDFSRCAKQFGYER
jgi:hypothetical protein